MTSKTNTGASSFFKKFGIVFLVIAIVVAGLTYFKVSLQAEKPIRSAIDASFKAYVSAYTAGVISKTSTIKIQLAEQYADSTQLGEELEAGVFDFTPSVAGKATWSDARTLEFVPSELLTSGETYKLEFKLGDLVDVPDHQASFSYEFRTVPQNYELELDGLEAYELRQQERQKLSGSITTADVAEEEAIEKLLHATQNGSELAVAWKHDAAGMTHQFVVEDIARTEKEGRVVLDLDGNALGVPLVSKEEIEVPSLSDFKVMSCKVVQHPSQYVTLRFSDPLDSKMQLQGLVRIEGLQSLRYQVTGNELRVFPAVRQTGEKEVMIEKGVKNLSGYALSEQFSAKAVFEQVKPALRFVGKGNVLPSSEGFVLPFEAVNLKAVDVTILKIYENNVAQFFQVNQLGGEREMKRVGRPILRKRVPLNTTGVTDLGKWNRFTLDLNELISTEQGAIYRVELNFKRAYSTYHCLDGSSEEEELTFTEEEDGDWDSSDEDSYWDDYGYYYGAGYNWQEREDPCSPSYYMGTDKKVAKNILASDLGLIAKGAEKGEMLVVVTDLKTAGPLAGIDVEIYNYQQQFIGTAKSDANGFARLPLKKKPYLLVAKSGTQRGYLRLDDGSSLSLSNFNTGGQKVEKGLKGFMYGERGVWRPGDSLHIAFILEDHENSLPESHPVVFELFNPIGQVTQKIIRSNGVNGFYNFSTATAEDAITGNWIAMVQVGGATFTKPLKIESIKPNRLKIKLDFGVEKITPENNKLNSELEVKWLHGAKAPNLEAEFSVSLKNMATKFEDYSEYTFDDQAKYFYGEGQQVFSGRLDADGKAIINTTLETEAEPPGMLNATFTGRVYEESGNFSIDQFSIPFSPYETYVGILPPKGDRSRNMLLTDTLHTLSIVTVNSDGEPVARDGIQLELYKLDWKWWWDNSDNNLSSYVGRYGRSPIMTGRVNSDGRAEWQFRVDYPEWGRFYVRAKDPVSGHSSGKIIYIDWPGWAGDSQKNMPGGATMLSFSTDKTKYNVGEQVHINITGSAQGRALLSIENGSKVVDARWVEMNKGQNDISFEVTEDMAPNVFAHITLLQPHSQTVNDLPIRMYGVAPVMVEDPETRLTPEIDMAEVLEPEQTFTVKVSEANDKPMTYTLAIVDEGLLDLTRFGTPDPWQKFYAREALGVKTWDIYDEVMGAFGGKLERLLAIGGGGSGREAKNAKANRFKPVVMYQGPFVLEPGNTNSHEIKMPSYVGSVRAMVVAGQAGAYGSAEATSPVKQALMVLGTLPRVLGPEEIVELPVNVFAMEDGVGNVEVTVETNELLNLENATQQVSFGDAGEKMLKFRMKTAAKLGIAKVNITAKGGGKVARHSIEVDLRNPNPPMVKVMDELVEAGKSWETDFNLFGMTGTNKAVLEVSTIPPINLGQRLKYLLNYPHGCIEQTTSSAFPQLFLANIMELDEATQAKTETNIKAAIERIQSFQNSDGGLSYWPGRGTSDEWGTNYAYHFLLEASAKGYNVPSDLMRKIKQYQRKMARDWSMVNAPSSNSSNLPVAISIYDVPSKEDITQAYRLYTLALAKSPEMGAMNRMREMKNMTLQAKWRLAAAYLLAGQKEAGEALVMNADKNIKEYNELSYTYGSALRDQAMILETICLMGDRKQGVDLLKAISNGLSEQNNWYSTQTTAYCLIAVAKFAMDESTGGEMAFTYSTNNGKEVKATTGLPLVQTDLVIQEIGTNNLKISNTSGQVLFARVIVEGTPSKGKEKASEKNLNMAVRYYDKDDNQIEIDDLVQGRDFFAEVTVSNPGLRGDYKEMALTQIFPSGWEIFNTRLFANSFAPGRKVDTPEYIDIRDDRVYMYFDLKAGQKKVFKVMLNSSFAGEYYLPAVQCEAMYDNSIYSNTAGKTVKVSVQEEQ